MRKDKKMEDKFWSRIEDLVRGNNIVIDRPKGSSHPHFPENRYPIDYGYIENTHAGDNAAVDIWIGSVSPGMLNGIICTIDELKGDMELKVIWGCNEEEIWEVIKFNNFGGQSGMLIRK
jgi:inorganic pyrophosphatase